MLSVLLCLVVYLNDPRFKITLISMLAEEYRTLPVLAVWTVEELWFLLTVVAIVTHATSLQVLSFENYLVTLGSLKDLQPESR